jgi:hypothetical protein
VEVERDVGREPVGILPLFDAEALQRDERRGEALHVEEVRRAQVLVAPFDARVDAGEVDLDLHHAQLRMILVDGRPAHVPAVELAVRGQDEIARAEEDGVARRLFVCPGAIEHPERQQARQRQTATSDRPHHTSSRGRPIPDLEEPDREEPAAVAGQEST